MTPDTGFRKTAAQCGVCFLGGMYFVFILAIFIPFPKGYFLEALGMALLLLFFSFLNGTILLGAVIAVILGVICAKLFLRIKNRQPALPERNIRRIKFVFNLGLLALGILLLVPIYHFVEALRDFGEQVGEVDMNGDGRVDKWIHQDMNYNLREIDYDIDGDGKADVFEYYDKNGKMKQRTTQKLK
jgi:membrane-bound ClpP family serine protease